MAYFKFIIALSLALFSSICAAGYAQVTPPLGYNQPTGSGAFYRTGSSAANSWSWANAAARANGSFNLGGRAITVPAYMRFAANAGRFVGYAIAINPTLRVAAGVAAFLSLAQIFWDEQDQDWKQTVQREMPFALYSIDGVHKFGSASEACNDWAIRQNLYKNFPTFSFTVYAPSSNNIQCVSDTIGGTFAYVGRYEGTAMTNVDVPISPDQLADQMENHPVPQEVPSILPPGVDIPLEYPPIINPSSDPIPVPQPLRIPLGEPVPVPNTDPQQWKTPVVDIVPSPTLDQPWRVDVQPKDIIKYDPSPITDPQVVNQEPAGQTQQEKTPGLCEQFPDILACQKPNFDTPSTDQIHTKDVAISITPDSGWGADNATCPTARHLPGANVDFEFTTICNFMSGFRPVMIAVSWLIAAMILIGFKRGV